MQFKCARGHWWEVSAEEFAARGEGVVTCPVCDREPKQLEDLSEKSEFALIKSALFAVGTGAAIFGALLGVIFFLLIVGEKVGLHSQDASDFGLVAIAIGCLFGGIGGGIVFVLQRFFSSCKAPPKSVESDEMKR